MLLVCIKTENVLSANLKWYFLLKVKIFQFKQCIVPSEICCKNAKITHLIFSSVTEKRQTPAYKQENIHCNTNIPDCFMTSDYWDFRTC